MKNLRIVGTLFAVLVTSTAMADDRGDEINRIITALEPAAHEETQVYSDQANDIEIIVDHDFDTIISDYAYSVEFPIFFSLNQSTLSEQAKETLSALGEAISSTRLEDHRYLIAGHTDARGNEAYNQALSLRRAEAVKRFLVNEYGIDPDRLEVFGWGETRLKRPENPSAAVNRRVEVSLVASQLVGTSPEITINIHQAGKTVSSKRESFSTIQKRFPQLKMRTSTIGKAVVKGSVEECQERVDSDPRPEQHKLDDFESGRTPLKCETEHFINKKQDRIKIR